MRISGTIKDILPNIPSRDFDCRVILSHSPYEINGGIKHEYCEFLTMEDKVSDLCAGMAVDIEFKITGREWYGPQGIKYFNKLIIESINET